ncbi:hypothetical protein COCOR_04351 [Corallococcus coralloides DSM 2259]|uniref:Lipoprotein n=1 Tax=Corallococcus coralloides (strain ATCC 25202 / DSM 2259 / NBRC 100086 / M2) TaxID=1144275 RepID=H8N1W3_CORCM|nr:hypothetical protein [Corallococcus coralloides]AFE05786.1 hypothetical protein COCOR_04351 [Corallococcus coralloides DSM 2259]
MRDLRALACVLALGAAVGLTGCDDDDPKPDGGSPLDGGTRDAGSPDSGSPDSGSPDSGTPDSGTPDAGTHDAGTPDAGPTATEFTAFVKDLIENQTTETGSPVTLDDKNFVDSEPTDAFPPEFFE